MSQLPSHTDSGTESSEPAIVPGSRRRRLTVTAVVVGLLVLFVVLHLTGVVGGESH
ncbi:MAG: hypothetical protein HOV87_04530 [Catenulispora sp.]|nr:hypothetical protein [Catenulispora sp.]